jgi:hypothetical protein
MFHIPAIRLTIPWARRESVGRPLAGTGHRPRSGSRITRGNSHTGFRLGSGDLRPTRTAWRRFRPPAVDDIIFCDQLREPQRADPLVRNIVDSVFLRSGRLPIFSLLLRRPDWHPQCSGRSGAPGTSLPPRRRASRNAPAGPEQTPLIRPSLCPRHFIRFRLRRSGHHHSFAAFAFAAAAVSARPCASTFPCSTHCSHRPFSSLCRRSARGRFPGSARRFINTPISKQ